MLGPFAGQLWRGPTPESCPSSVLPATTLLLELVVPGGSLNTSWVQSLGWENPLEKEMASLSSILAWEIPWTEGPGEL